MNHRAALELLPLFSLDALEEGEARAVELHVTACSACLSELAGYAAVTRALSGELEPGPDVWPSIMARIGGR